MSNENNLIYLFITQTREGEIKTVFSNLATLNFVFWQDC